MSDELIVSNADELDDFQRMTRKQAEDMDCLLREGEARTRLRIYLMYKCKGYEQLGFDDFAAYCESRLDTTRQTAYNWISQIEATLHAHGTPVKQFVSNGLTNEIEMPPLIPVRSASQLIKLPTPEARRRAWNEIETITQGPRSESQRLPGLKKIVNRMLSNIKYDVTASDPISERAQRIEAKRAEKAQRESEVQTNEATSPAPAFQPPPVPKPSPVKSFTPAPQPEVEEFDFLEWESEEVKVLLDTVTIWAINREIDGSPRTRHQAVKLLQSLADWIERGGGNRSPRGGGNRSPIERSR